MGEDGLFLSFQPEARSGEIWISGMVYPPEGLDYLVRAFEVAAADFDTTIAQKIVRMTSIASVSSERAEVVDAYAKKRKSLKAVVERLGRQYGDCYLDESRPGKFDLVMKVL
ncbi:hypothetical protein SUH3_08815 [Pseudosulfitobacter pseudonitzschiae]|uniref:Uncharacterized protein n=1 Tax=Pseudosulfitobacter pseudonitzschiae TaxID=1402135 RepID=A0A073JGL7_9RHOB|nr:hypothetical protein SUH3_08815 [Pseudosulfitobacter pseudonitzschiae]